MPTSPKPPKVPSWADRLFAALLRAYPAAFREEYDGEMRSAFRGRWREERRARGVLGVAGLWAGLVLDTVANAPRVHGEILWHDLRTAWRSLTRRENGSFTAAALLTLALGIGAVTAIYSLFHAVLLAPLPFPDAERVVRIWDTNPARDIPEFSSSVPNFRSWQERARGFSGLVALGDAPANLTGGGEPERVAGVAVSERFWQVLGLPPVAGRTFSPAEEAGGVPVVMIGEGLWRRRYGGDRALLGRAIDVNGAPHVVVGIAPQDVGFATTIDLWTPLPRTPADEDPADRSDRVLAVLGRLPADVPPAAGLARARREMEGIAAQLAREFPDANRDWSVRLAPVREWIVAPDFEQRLKIVLAAVGLLLLVAASNVANLQIARAGGPRGQYREVSVRLALGASRSRLVRQLVTESLVLAAAGGALGLGVAAAAVRLAGSLLPEALLQLATPSLNRPVLLAAVGCTVATALLTGLLPAGASVRGNVRDALQQAGRTATGARAPARQVLVAVQIALATTLVVGAALLVQSLARLETVALGFADPDHLLTARISRPGGGEEGFARNSAFYDALAREVGALPGVAAVGLSSEAPFGGGDTSMAVRPDRGGSWASESGEADVQASWRLVDPGSFATLQIPVVRGRVFDPARDPERVVMLSAGLARRLWPRGEDPVGRVIRLENDQTFTVTGVVGDVRQLGLAEEPGPTMYLSTGWYLWPTMTLVVRTAGEPAALAPAIRQAVARVDPHQPVDDFRTMRRALADSAAAPRLHTALLAAFAGLALLLAVVGVVGVVSYTVAQRTREIAVRQALGATPGQAVGYAARQGLPTCLLGILAGLAGALALGRALAGVLFAVDPHDPATLVATCLVLLAVAALACWLPARRASRIAPGLALRE